MAYRLLIAISLAFSFAKAAIATTAIQTYSDFMFRLRDDLSLDLEPLLGPNPLSLAELQKIAAAAGSYEKFLAALQQRAPELFNNYVLLHHSRSLQDASPEQPRLVLFGGGLFLAFFEDATTADRVVEGLAFNPATATFSTMELVYPADGLPEVKTNPAECAACHGQERKPLWNPYDFWPNAYGAAIGRFHSTQEAAAYSDFFSAPNRQGIYAYVNDQARVDDDPRQRSRRLDSPETFTQAVAAFNFLRIAAKFDAAKSVVGPFKYALYGALSRCAASQSDFAGFFPAPTFNQAALSYRAMVTGTQQARQRFEAGLTKSYQTLFPDYTTLFAVDQNRLSGEALIMAQVRFIYENLGLTVEDWPTSMGENPYFLSTPSNFSFDLLEALAPRDAATMRGARGVFSASFLRLDCALLAEQSRQALQGVSFPLVGERSAVSSVPVAGACSRCHNTSGSAAPQIPFDEAPALRALLRQKPGLAAEIKDRIERRGTGQMPPAGRLSVSDINALNTYVERLLDKQ